MRSAGSNVQFRVTLISDSYAAFNMWTTNFAYPVKNLYGDASAVAIIADVLTIARDRAAIVPAPVLVPARDIHGLSDSSFAEAV